MLVFGVGPGAQLVERRVGWWRRQGDPGSCRTASPSAAASTKGEGKKDCKGKNKFRGGERANGKRKACQGTTSDPASTPTPTPTPTPPPAPSGPCPDGDVLVTPTVPDPVAGRDVTIVLNLQMGTTEACTWRVSSDSVTVKIYAGADDVWLSRECPGAIPAQDVVVRRDVATAVPMIWSSKRSDEYCTNRTAWVLPGVYQVAAAALEGEGTDVAFELRTPVAAVVTQTVEPSEQSEP